MSKIDFVVSWVDSGDPTWITKKNRYMGDIQDIKNDNVSEERYRDYGTLMYFFRSVEKYASWVNHIYLITDNQIPKWLNSDNKKVTVIDHRDIIDSKYLPLFNSNAIEWNMNSIPGLSDNFVYFNDDYLLNGLVQPEDFFIDGKPRDYRLYKSLYPKEDFDNIPFNDVRLLNQFLIKGNWPLNKTGLFSFKYGKEQVHNLIQLRRKWVSGYIEPHSAYSFTKSTFRKVKEIWKQQVNDTNSYRFRSSNDISIWLVRYYQLETGFFVPRSPKFSAFHTIADLPALEREFNNDKVKVLCVNDEEVVDYDHVLQQLRSLLNAKYPEKSSFEK